MKYNILECRIEFKNNQIFSVTVLVEMSKFDIRAIYANTEPACGYMSLKQNESISNELLQEVAGYGYEKNDKDYLFPDWKKKYFK